VPDPFPPNSKVSVAFSGSSAGPRMARARRKTRRTSGPRSGPSGSPAGRARPNGGPSVAGASRRATLAPAVR
jgi:hypothetical protein